MMITSGVGFKIVGLLFWPVLLILLSYLFNKEKFKRRWQRFKQRSLNRDENVE